MKCLLFSLMDLVSSFIVVLSYKYTNIASVLLLTSLSGPLSMIFSYFMLRQRYSAEKVLTCISCILFSAIFTLMDL